ncbi:Uncharacterised protein [Raoultella terrigena]|uniref:Uncharacterized protein n=1 Tax=Raoultella terrigena TaxID=577 RepID=A0A4U9DH29_RAOTE|nr:Uncharacterised protein [Raoultella terrigena]
MGISDAVNSVKQAVYGVSSQVSDGLTFDSTLSNIKLLAINSEDLQCIISRFESGGLTQEQFLAKGVSFIAKELITLRDEAENKEVRSW